MKQQFQRILIIKMRFHGDMLLTTPVISSLKKNYPDAKIDVLLYQDTIPILSENSEINALYGIEKKNVSNIAKVKNIFSLIKTLRANRYDLIINLADQWSSAFIVRLLPAKVKISPNFHHRQSRLWKKTFTYLTPFSGEHVVEHNLSTLQPLGLQHLVTTTKFEYRQEQWESISQRLQQVGVNREFVVIQPTARQLFKCWDNDKFAQVIDAIYEKGYQVILTSGPSTEDLACVNEIAEYCKIKPISALAGKTHFTELGALIDHAALFIGVDSAPGHIAAAVNTPVISLFGATNHTVWKPWAENVVVLSAGDYQRMPPREELDRNKKYLSIIPAEDVIAAINQILPEPTQTLSLSTNS